MQRLLCVVEQECSIQLAMVRPITIKTAPDDATIRVVYNSLSIFVLCLEIIHLSRISVQIEAVATQR